MLSLTDLRRAIPTLAVAFAALPLSPSFATGWVQGGPIPAPDISAIAWDPVASGTVYAGGYGIVFKSINSGRGWDAASLSNPNAQITALRVAPKDHETVYAATTAGPWRSRDGGATWAPMVAGGAGFATSVVTGLALDPTTAGTVFASTYDDLFKSGNSGTSWLGFPVTGGISALSAAAGTTATTVFAGITDGHLATSADAGVHWSYKQLLHAPRKSSSFNGSVDGVAAVTGTATVYAWADYYGTFSVSGVQYSSATILKSTNGGGAWAPIDTGLHRTHWDDGSAKGVDLPDVQGGAFDFDAGAPDKLYLGNALCCNGAPVYRSADAGATWIPTPAGGQSFVNAVAVQKATNPVVLVGGPGGMARSTDAGQGWTRPGQGLYGSRVNALAADPARAGTFYASTDGGLFVTADDAKTWTPDSAGLSTLQVGALGVDTIGGAKYLADRAGLFTLTAGAKSWTRVVLGHVGAPGVLAVDPLRKGGIFLSDGFGNSSVLWISHNAGQSWSTSQLTSPDGNFAGIVALLPSRTRKNVLYAGTEAGIFKSSDGGASWTQPVKKVGVMAMLAGTGGRLYAVGQAYGASGDRLYVSTDGVTWSAKGTTLPTAAAFGGLNDLVAEPNSTRLFILAYGATDGPLYESTDAGLTWVALADNLPNAPSHLVATATALYADSFGQDVWRLPYAAIPSEAVLRAMPKSFGARTTMPPGSSFRRLEAAPHLTRPASTN